MENFYYTKRGKIIKANDTAQYEIENIYHHTLWHNYRSTMIQGYRPVGRLSGETRSNS